MKTWIVSLLLVLPFSALANQITITEIETPAEHVQMFQNMQTEYQILDAEPASASDWWNIGKQVWELIESMAGKMRIEAMRGVGVIPQSANSISSMTDWKMVQPKSYRLEIGGNVAGKAFSFDYTVGFNYGGKHEGKGNFLSNVGIIPFNAKCGWTWTCDAVATVGDAVNTGTGRDPVVSLPITMVVNAQGRVNAKAAGVLFTVYGNGQLTQTVTDMVQ